jgi:AcrR family transcriptional regulator
MALILIDRDGLGKLTMRRLSKELDVTPMALYHHVPNKAALLDGVCELIWRAAIVPARAEPIGNFRQQLGQAMTRLRTELLRHPSAVPLLATHPLVTPGQLELVGVAVDILQRSGMPITPTTLYRLNNLVVFTFGHVLAEVAEPAGGAGGDVDIAVRDAVIAAYPALREVLAPLTNRREPLAGESLGPGGAPTVTGSQVDDDSDDYSPDRQFRLGLHSLLAEWSNTD